MINQIVLIKLMYDKSNSSHKTDDKPSTSFNNQKPSVSYKNENNSGMSYNNPRTSYNNQSKQMFRYNNQVYVPISRKCGTKHAYAQCPAFGKECLKCGEKNHFANCCRRNYQNDMNTNDNRNRVNEILEYDISTVKIIHNVQSESFETIKINGLPVSFKIDTGAGVNILSKKIFELMFSNVPLKKSNIILESFGGFTVQPMGMFQCCLEFKERTTIANV